MPKTWSDWFAFVGAIIGSVTGVLGFAIAYAALRRDRADLLVSVQRVDYEWAATLKMNYPNLHLGSPQPGNDTEPRSWYVLTIVNRGLRPIHLEQAGAEYVEVAGPGSMSGSSPFEQVLTEEKRRVHVAFMPSAFPKSEFYSCFVSDDTGRVYRVFSPAWPLPRRLSWQLHKMLALRREKREVAAKPGAPPN